MRAIQFIRNESGADRGAPHVAHISARDVVAMVEFTLRKGLPVSCEAKPHHFSLIDVEMPPHDSNYKMKPLLRAACDRGTVVEGIVAGTVTAIATDHAPHPGSRKCRNSNPVRSALLVWKRRSRWRSRSWWRPERSH